MVVPSSAETTVLLLQLLHTLVSTPEGAKAVIYVEDVSSLSEIAPTHAIVLDIFCFAWLNGMTIVLEKHILIRQIADTTQALVSSFSGTDGVTLLEFLGTFLRQADPSVSQVIFQFPSHNKVFSLFLIVSHRFCHMSRDG